MHVNMVHVPAEDRLLMKTSLIEKSWPPDLPHYSVSGALQQLAYTQSIKDIDRLKQGLNCCLDTMSQELINDVIDQWLLVIHLIFRMDTLTITYINSVTFACCKLYFCHALP